MTSQDAVKPDEAVRCLGCSKSLAPQEVNKSRGFCGSCHALDQMVRRNLGAYPEAFTTEDKKNFFARAVADRVGGRYEWCVVRALLKEQTITRRSHQNLVEVGGAFLPLSVWTSKGYDEEHVRRCPSELDAVGELTYQVPVKSVTHRSLTETVEEEFLQRETDLRQKKAGKKKTEGEDGPPESVLHVPAAAAPETGAKGADPAKAAAREERKAASTKAKLERVNRTTSVAAAKALQPLTQKLAAVQQLLQKTNLSEPERGELLEAQGQLQVWAKASRDFLSAYETQKDAELPPLPFEGADLKGALAASAELMKKVKAEHKRKKNETPEDAAVEKPAKRVRAKKAA